MKRVFTIVTGTGFDQLREILPSFEEQQVATPFGDIYVQMFDHGGNTFVHANRHSAHAPLEQRLWRLPMCFDRGGRECFLDPRPLVYALESFHPLHRFGTTAVGTPQDLSVGSIALLEGHLTPEFGITSFCGLHSGAEFHQPKGQVFCTCHHELLDTTLADYDCRVVSKNVLRITRGPGFESHEDADRLRDDGITIVGMHTALPEAYCWHELGHLITAAGVITDSFDEHPDQPTIERIAKQQGQALFRTFLKVAGLIASADATTTPLSCSCPKFPVPGLSDKLCLNE
ncbi:hypothetical protein KKG41_00400 [Patescibacteria group bacterium]|nr:hypothetical protein [Patescibacteria group bacterium]MBU1890953.1 hypothetical protein [Patescibacteria group bacterium]